VQYFDARVWVRRCRGQGPGGLGWLFAALYVERAGTRSPARRRRTVAVAAIARGVGAAAGPAGMGRAGEVAVRLRDGEGGSLIAANTIRPLA